MEVMVFEMVNIKNTNSRIAPFPLHLVSGNITRANYSNTFRLYRNASLGVWRMQFSIKDSAGVHYTKYGYFYIYGSKGNTLDSYWQDLFEYLEIVG